MFAEFRFAARALARWRAGAGVAILTLAVGIGTTTSLFALVRVMLADFPGVPELDRVGRVYASSQALGIERSQAALNEFESGPSHATSFAAIGAYAQADVTLGSGSWIALVGVCGGVAALSVFLATYRIVRLEPSVVLRRL